MQFEYSLFQVQPNIYLLQTDNIYDVSMIFWRAQEFYESANPRFQNGTFTLLEYMDWYSKTYSTDQSFTYPSDYIGYNVPSDTILQCYTQNDERTPYDEFMLKITQDLFFRQGGGRFYLIGSMMGDMATLDHEMAHGFFYTDKEYREEMLTLIQQLPHKKEITRILNDMLYAESVYDDEIQAFFATGLVDDLKKFRKHTKPFIQAFLKKKGKFKLPPPIKTETVNFFGA